MADDRKYPSTPVQEKGVSPKFQSNVRKRPRMRSGSVRGPRPKADPLVYPLTWCMLMDWGGLDGKYSSGGLFGVLNEIVGSYRVGSYPRNTSKSTKKRPLYDAKTFKLNQEKDYYPLDSLAVQYAAKPGPWWRYFPSTLEAFRFPKAFKTISNDVTVAYYGDMIEEYPPMAWNYNARLYKIHGFRAEDEIASVMVNPNILLRLSEDMKNDVLSGVRLEFGAGQTEMLDSAIQLYAKTVQAWTVSFLAVPTNFADVTAAPPVSLPFAEFRSKEYPHPSKRIAFFTVNKGRTCPVPRPPAHAYAVKLPLLLSQSAADRISSSDLLLQETFTTETKRAPSRQKTRQSPWLHQMHNVYKHWTEWVVAEHNRLDSVPAALEWKAPDGASEIDAFPVDALGVVPPEVLFGSILMREMNESSYHKGLLDTWMLLGAVALDTLGAHVGIGRQYISYVGAGGAPNKALNFCPVETGHQVSRIDAGQLVSGVLAELKFIDRIGVFRATEQVKLNVFTFGDWLTATVGRMQAHLAETNQNVPTTAGLVCMQRFLVAMESDLSHEFDKSALAIVKEWWDNAATSHSETMGSVTHDMDYAGECLAIAACAVARCGLEVVFTASPEGHANEPLAITMTIRGHIAGALTQYKVGTRVLFDYTGLARTAKYNQHGDPNRANAEKYDEKVMVNGTDYPPGSNVHIGHTVPLELFAYSPKDDQIVAHGRGPRLNAKTKRGIPKSTDGIWGARWQAWTSVGRYELTGESSKIDLSVSVFPWAVGGSDPERVNDSGGQCGGTVKWTINTKDPKHKATLTNGVQMKITQVSRVCTFASSEIKASGGNHVLQWNYFLQFTNPTKTSTNVEVFVADVCLSADNAYWRAVWANTAGADRWLYSGSMRAKSGATFASLYPALFGEKGAVAERVDRTSGPKPPQFAQEGVSQEHDVSFADQDDESDLVQSGPSDWLSSEQTHPECIYLDEDMGWTRDDIDAHIAALTARIGKMENQGSYALPPIKTKPIVNAPQVNSVPAGTELLIDTPVAFEVSDLDWFRSSTSAAVQNIEEEEDQSIVDEDEPVAQLIVQLPQGSGAQHLDHVESMLYRALNGEL